MIVIAPLITLSNAQQITPVISIKDPEGDDRGPGYYGYPSNSVFKPGVFDLTKFEIYTNSSSVIFKVYFKDLGGNPWNGPNGFCLQYVQIYVHTTMSGVPARMDTLGLNVVLRSDYAWHFAFLLAPGWDTQAVPVGQKSALYYANGTVIVQDTIFSVHADTANNAIVAEVSKNILPDIDNIASWKIVVAVASYDGFGSLRVRTAGVTGGEWVINASRYASPGLIPKISKAIAAGIEPRVLDLLVYSSDYPNGITADQQYAWLDSYNVDLKTLAVVPALPLQTTTIIQTSTVTQTVTMTQTRTQIQTTTIPQTTTVEKTITVPTTTTTTVTTTDWTTASILSIVLLIIGIGIGYVVKRR
ncbi:MAG: glucodextranase DOMON-like domain-containing protein [Thermoprotei archaeon]